MWVWVNSASWWWTGRPGMLWFMGLQRVRHDWATELNPDGVRQWGRGFSGLMMMVMMGKTPTGVPTAIAGTPAPSLPVHSPHHHPAGGVIYLGAECKTWAPLVRFSVGWSYWITIILTRVRQDLLVGLTCISLWLAMLSVFLCAYWPSMLQTVQSLSRVQLFVTPWTAACQASLSITRTPVSDVIQPSHPLSSPSPSTFNLS